MQSAPSLTGRELLHARLDALLADCDLVAEHSAYGETFDDMEVFFLTHGRKFLQETFQEKLQERIERTASTSEAKQCPHCKKNALPRRQIERHNFCSRGSPP